CTRLSHYSRPHPPPPSLPTRRSSDLLRPGETALDPRHLESHRIVAHDVRDPRAKSFDILRTQVLRTMDTSHWQILAVTSPTPGRSEEHTSELQSRFDLVCRLLLEKKK